MAKKSRIPKKIAGVKVPKPLRKSKMLRSMMASDLARDVLAKALTAVPGAAAPGTSTSATNSNWRSTIMAARAGPNRPRRQGAIFGSPDLRTVWAATKCCLYG
ncbi:hypothetical protein ACVMB3_007230 [Sinorhizobium meliloti]